MRLSRKEEIFLNENIDPSVVVAAAEYLNPALFDDPGYFQARDFLSEYVPFESPLTIEEFNEYYYQAIAGEHPDMDEMISRALPRVIYLANKLYSACSKDFSAYNIFATVYSEYQYLFFEMVESAHNHDSPYASHYSMMNYKFNRIFHKNIDDLGIVYAGESNDDEPEYFDMESLQQLYEDFLKAENDDPRLEITRNLIMKSRNSFHDFVILYLSEVVNLPGREIGAFLKRGGSTAINARRAIIKGNIHYHWRNHPLNPL